LAIGLGVVIATGIDVSCKIKTATMADGVTCTNRSGNTLTYLEWQSQQRQYSLVAFGLGGVLLIGGTIGGRAAEAPREYGRLASR